MKKIIFIFTVAAFFIATSCNSAPTPAEEQETAFQDSLDEEKAKMNEEEVMKQIESEMAEDSGSNNL